MKSRLVAIHPQGEGTLMYDTLVIRAHPRNLWL